MVAIDASLYLRATTESQNPPKMMTDTEKNVNFTKEMSLNGASQFLIWPRFKPQTINPRTAHRKRIRVACRAEIEATPALTRIIPTDMHKADSNAYFMPARLFSLIFACGVDSHNTHVTPAHTKNIPIHPITNGFSLRKKTARSTVKTGPNMFNNIVNLGPKYIRARKKKVSPKAMPTKPLVPNRMKERLSMGFHPNNKMIVPRYRIPMIPLARFIPRGGTLSPSLLNKMDPKAQAAAETRAAELPNRVEPCAK